MNTIQYDLCSMFAHFARSLDLGLDKEPPELDPPPRPLHLPDLITGDGGAAHREWKERGCKPSGLPKQGGPHRWCSSWNGCFTTPKLDPAIQETIALLRKRRQLEKEGRWDALRLFFRSHPAHKLIAKKGPEHIMNQNDNTNQTEQKPTTNSKCMNPDCPKLPYSRGLCVSCYGSARSLVKNGLTSWEELVKKGKANEPVKKVGKRQTWLLS